jgi:DNA-directed RNA polymerase specialized sigma24 family protein
MLRCFEGLDNREVATLLELNPETTKKRFARALVRLQELLRLAGVTEAMS